MIPPQKDSSKTNHPRPHSIDLSELDDVFSEDEDKESTENLALGEKIQRILTPSDSVPEISHLEKKALSKYLKVVEMRESSMKILYVLEFKQDCFFCGAYLREGTWCILPEPNIPEETCDDEVQDEIIQLIEYLELKARAMKRPIEVEDTGDLVKRAIAIKKLVGRSLEEEPTSENLLSMKLLAEKVLEKLMGQVVDEAFQKEIGLLMDLDNPGLPKILNKAQLRDSFVRESLEAPIVLMEFVEGKALRDFLDEGGCQDRYLPFEIALKITRIIRYLHWVPDASQATQMEVQKISVAHRDLNPSNIILQFKEDGELLGLKVIDLGVSSPCIDTQTFNEIIRAKGDTASLLYTAPESNNIGKEGDIFSIGIILHEMLNGTHIVENQKDQLMAGKTISVGLDQDKLPIIFIRKIYEHLISWMINLNPGSRPAIENVETLLEDMKLIEGKVQNVMRIIKKIHLMKNINRKDVTLRFNKLLISALRVSLPDVNLCRIFRLMGSTFELDRKILSSTLILHPKDFSDPHLKILLSIVNDPHSGPDGPLDGNLQRDPQFYDRALDNFFQVLNLNSQTKPDRNRFFKALKWLVETLYLALEDVEEIASEQERENT